MSGYGASSGTASTPFSSNTSLKIMLDGSHPPMLVRGNQSGQRGSEMMRSFLSGVWIPLLHRFRSSPAL
ncbi:hypothetical protein DsansV1_C05g0056901 [Dioscorea sansibarensis]